MKIPAKPQRRPQSADEFVTGKEKPKRLTIDVPADLHRRAKAGAASEGVFIADLVRDFLEQRFPG